MATRILVVDDNMMTLDLVSRSLSRVGFDVTTAESGSAALAIVDEVNPDLIILDVMMPEKGGALVYLELKTNPVYRDIPLILFSGVDSESFAHYVKMVNMTRKIKIPFPKYYVEKSADPDYLREVIKKCIQ